MHPGRVAPWTPVMSERDLVQVGIRIWVVRFQGLHGCKHDAAELLLASGEELA